MEVIKGIMRRSGLKNECKNDGRKSENKNEMENEVWEE